MNKMFECEYCGEVKHNELLMEFHENKCEKNPKNEECYTCEFFDMDVYHCEKDINVTNDNCLFHKQKKKIMGTCAKCGKTIYEGEIYMVEKRIDGNKFCKDCY